MPNQPGVWGIDVGLCALKAIRLENIGGQVTATAFDYVEHPKILSQPDADPDQLTREALEKFLTRNTLRGDQVGIAVPGQSGLARFVKLPPVEEKKITDIVRFEAKQQIPFPLDEVVWDYQKIGSGTVTNGFAMETEIGLFAMKRDMVNRALQPFRDVGIDVHLVQMAPLALCNYASYDLLKKERKPVLAAAEGEDEGESEDAGGKNCVVALDIGTDNSNLVVSDGVRIIWQRPIPLGGNHFTRALTKELKLTFAKAEHLKRNATKSPDLKKILAALKPVLNDFVGEAQRSLGYFTNTHRDAQIQYMVGLGNAFRLPGLQKFLSEKLQLDVRKLQKLERLAGDSVITAPAFTQNMLSFAVAYGVALQGLGLTQLQTTLLPPEIQFDRMIRAKKPWAVAAAAALLLGVPALTLGYAMQLHAVAAKPVLDAITEGDALKESAAKKKQAFDSKKKEVESNENAVKVIVAGLEERLNWIRLNRFVNDCLPEPALRVEGKFQGLAPGKPDAVVVMDRDNKKHEVPLRVLPTRMTGIPTQGAVLLVDNKPVPLDDAKARELKEGDIVTVVYQADQGARRYWTPMALDAYLKQYDRQAGAKESEGRADEQGIENLIQVNLEAVDSRYGDLRATVQEIIDKSQGGRALGMPENERNTLPDGKGWAIELRGYSYHRQLEQFVMDTFLDNLKERAKEKQQAKAPAAQAGAVAPGAAPPVAAPGAVTPKPAQPATVLPGADKKAAGPAAVDKKEAGDVPPKAPAGKPDATAKKPQDAAPKSAAPAAPVEEPKFPWKISHVVLFHYRTQQKPDYAKFDLIAGSHLPSVIKEGGGPSPSGGTPSGPGGGGTILTGGVSPAGTTGGGKGWQSLLGAGAAAGPVGGAAGSPGNTGGPGGGTVAGPVGAPGANPTQNKPGDTGPKTKGREPTRTEFVIFLVAKEVASGPPGPGR